MDIFMSLTFLDHFCDPKTPISILFFGRFTQAQENVGKLKTGKGKLFRIPQSGEKSVQFGKSWVFLHNMRVEYVYIKRKYCLIDDRNQNSIKDKLYFDSLIYFVKNCCVQKMTGSVWCGVVCNMATMLIHQVRLVQSSQCPAGPACFVLYSSFTIFYFSTDV